MSKTFKSAYPGRSNQSLEIVRADNRVRVSVDHASDGARGIIIAPSDAPALALAILEAAGVKPEHPEQAQVSFGSPGHLSQIVFELGRFVKAEAMHSKLAREQAELEAEALELFNVVREHDGEPRVATWDGFHAGTMEVYLLLARRAREIAKEATK